jgi:hypothetical protein
VSLTINNLTSNSAWDYENGFHWFSEQSRINKMLAHYELYKMIVDLPGDIFELGVYKGASLIRFCTFRALLESEDSRKIIGFDAFGHFPRERLSLNEDLSFIDGFEIAGGDGLSQEDLSAVLNNKAFRNYQLIKGNIFDTVPDYLKKHPYVKLSLVHLDMDVKEPTEFALDIVFDRLVPGGLLVVDDYNAVAGATEAVDLFVKRNKLSIRKLRNYRVPSYILK